VSSLAVLCAEFRPHTNARVGSLTGAPKYCAIEYRSHPLQHPRRRFRLREPDGLENSEDVGGNKVGDGAIPENRQHIVAHRALPLLNVLGVGETSLSYLEERGKRLPEGEGFGLTSAPILSMRVSSFLGGVTQPLRLAPCFFQADVREHPERTLNAPTTNRDAQNPPLRALLCDDQPEATAILVEARLASPGDLQRTQAMHSSDTRSGGRLLHERVAPTTL
jgi:hypothetical protein